MMLGFLHIIIGFAHLLLNFYPWLGLLAIVLAVVFLVMAMKLSGWDFSKSMWEQPKEDSISSSSSSIITNDDLENNFERFSWQEMENLVGKLFEKKGYSVTVTPPQGDFGIDVEAKNDREFIGIQVKHWKFEVGFEHVAKTIGSAVGKFNKSILINTKSGFTPPAWEHQQKNKYVLELWDSEKFKDEMKKAFLENVSASSQESNGPSITSVPDEEKDDSVYDRSAHFKIDDPGSKDWTKTND